MIPATGLKEDISCTKAFCYFARGGWGWGVGGGGSLNHDQDISLFS